MGPGLRRLPGILEALCVEQPPDPQAAVLTSHPQTLPWAVSHSGAPRPQAGALIALLLYVPSLFTQPFSRPYSSPRFSSHF